MSGNQAIGFAGDYLLANSMANALNTEKAVRLSQKQYEALDKYADGVVRDMRKRRPYDIARRYFARLNSELARECGVRAPTAGSFYDSVAAVASACQR